MKKGLSNIVASVLIILIVIIAASMLWFILSPFLKESTEELGGATDCLTINMDLISCYRTNYSSIINGVYTTVNLQRKQGSGNLVDLKILFKDQQGKTVLRDITNSTLNRTAIIIPEEFETTKATFLLTDFVPEEAEIVLVVPPGERLCRSQNIRASCTILSKKVCPDLTTTAIVGNPGFGVPDNTVNSEDFFYYTIKYTENNLTIADSDENGILTSEDFFIFLDSLSPTNLNLCN